MGDQMEIDGTSTSVESVLPWEEKYRPKTFDEILGPPSIIERLKSIARTSLNQNLLLTGPPGTGKTTSILCLARALYGKDYKDHILELNASHDRGIGEVRGRIKTFASLKRKVPGGHCKLIFLDEADSMTGPAQKALLGIITTYSASTRFALSCNNHSKIIPALQSRCSIVKFERATDEQLLSRLIHICQEEQVAYENDGLATILAISWGDLRQSIVKLMGASLMSGIVNKETVMWLYEEPVNWKFDEIAKDCVKGEYEEADRKIDELVDLGVCGEEVARSMYASIQKLDVDAYQKLEFLQVLVKFQQRVVRGSDVKMMSAGLVADLCHIASNDGCDF